MPYHSRILSKDEELGKRDDDFRPKRAPTYNGFNVLRWRKRRLFALIAGLVLVYLFVANPPADLRRVDGRRYGQPAAQRSFETVPTSYSRREPTGPPPRLVDDREEDDKDKQYYEGPIKFYRLASSLHAIGRTMGQRNNNRNVLFAASSLKSVANLMPMACEMTKWDRNYVHMAIMGRENMSLDQILEINGVSRDEFPVAFHDGRGDYSEYSTDLRLEVAVGGAMRHINEFMHPQAIIMDDSAIEDKPFTRACAQGGKSIAALSLRYPKAHMKNSCGSPDSIRAVWDRHRHPRDHPRRGEQLRLAHQDPLLRVQHCRLARQQRRLHPELHPHPAARRALGQPQQGCMNALSREKPACS